MKKKLNKLLSFFIAAVMLMTAAMPAVSAVSETLPCGYEIDMDNLPKVHFAEHPEWEELYNETWEIHKNNIDKIPAATNPEEPYYVDEAFSGNIFVWDTMLMMMFDKYGINEFPTLASIDNFYYNQVDSDDERNGYICREIVEDTGEDYWDYATKKNTGTNPPLFAMAEWEQYQIHGDVSRFSKVINGKTIFERLVAQYNYIENNKKMPNGLYGKTNGFGNGLDNTPNQDGNQLSTDDKDGNQTYNDLSIQQAQAAYFISLIADAMGDEENAEYFMAEHDRISALINEILWSDEAQMYSNIAEDGVTQTNISTPTNLWALAGHVATEERAEAIIKNHGLNSQKLFRPNGLATTSYDWENSVSRFHAEGAYWLGSVWAPTSYQYTYGLKDCGYGDLAFEEAIRHVDAVSDVYQAGKLGTYVTEPTLWENYSSEYTRNGYSGTSSNSRPHFAGWTGSFGIGMMIENILGVDINAPDNIITWDVRLSEEHGVDNLYMCHEGVENRVSLHAGSRTSASSTLNFTITTEQPVTVVVNACGGTRTINAEPGTHSYTIEGVDEEAQAGYVGAIAYPIDMTDETVMNMLSKDYLDENAKDYVIFGTEINETVDDGIGYQYGKSDIIYNVNTVGIPWTQTGENPTVLSDSTLMDELGFDGAQSVSKGYHIYGDEGFMFMAPAGTGLQTLRAVVGVKGGNAELKAALSDASDARVTIPVSGGEEESLYYIDIPFRADSDGRNILVKWTVDTDKSSSSAEISLKSVALFDGGYFIPGEPEEIEVTFAEDDITVNAAAPADETYDVWHVELYNDDGDMVDSVSTDTMPVTFENLDYYEKYYARVAGEKDGITGIYGTSDTVLLEEEGMTDAGRVQKDLEMTLDAIYNGNTERNVINDFNTNVEGVLYGSEFSLVSTTDGETAGVQNGGRVIRAVNGVDKVSSITITAAYNGETAVHENDVVVRALDTGGEYAIAHTDTVYQNQVFLSEEGTKDWVQIVSDFGSGEPQAEKKDGTGIENLIRVHDAVPGGESGMMTDAPVTYIYDSDDCGDVTPVNNRGSHMRGVGNYLQFDVPYSDKYQTVNLYCGVWYAEARAEFLINGAPVASETYSADALRTFKITFDYKLDDPNDKASVRLILTNDNIVETNDNGSAYINAITLSESDTAFAYIPDVYVPEEPVEEEPENRTDPFSGTVNLTEEGTNDWFQLQADTETEYARKAGGTGISEFKREHEAVPDGEKGRVKDAPIYYEATDADSNYASPIDRSGMQVRGVGNGFSFRVGYSDVMQTLRVYTGVWNGGASLEFIVNGEVQYSEYISGQDMNVFCSTINYKLDSPDDVAIVRLTLRDMTSFGVSSGSTFIFGATLSNFGDSVVEEPDIGTIIEAVDYTYKTDARDPNNEICGIGGRNMGGINAGTFLSYNVETESGGLYDLTLQYAASSDADIQLIISVDGEQVATLDSVSGTGGWQNWEYVTIEDVPIPAGAHNLKLYYTNGGSNLRQLGFTRTAPLASVTVDGMQTANEQFDITINSFNDISSLVFKNENGGKISAKIKSVTQNEDGTYTAVASMTIGTAGERVINVYEGNDLLCSFNVTVENVPTEIVELNAPAAALAGEPFEVTAVVSKDLTRAKFFNSSDDVIGKRIVSTQTDGNYTTTVYEISVGTRGIDREFTFRAAKGGTSEFNYEKSFMMIIV